MVSRKQYWAIKESLTKAEKALIDYYEIQYMLRNHVPTVTEVVDRLNFLAEKAGKPKDVTQTSVNYYLNRKPVQRALDDRGIPWKQHSEEGLTTTQIATASLVTNFADERSIKEKLDDLGVNPTQYQAWLADPQFYNLVQARSEQNLKNIKPTAITEFTKKIQQGDWNALKYYLDATGAAKGNDAPQSEMVIRLIIESLQRHVKDSNVIGAVAKDILAILSNRNTEILGEIVEEDQPTLEQAKRAIGFG